MLALLVDGVDSRGIMAEAGIKGDTLRNYFTRIFNKTGMGSRLELVLMVVRNPILDARLAEYLAEKRRNGNVDGTVDGNAVGRKSAGVVKGGADSGTDTTARHRIGSPRLPRKGAQLG